MRLLLREEQWTGARRRHFHDQAPFPGPIDSDVGERAADIHPDPRAPIPAKRYSKPWPALLETGTFFLKPSIVSSPELSKSGQDTSGKIQM